ncbi:tyrosine-type recombinase/integrase [Fundicoccus sp. Sow4_H7]|uniref:tyrosine-type recombinase/integrase n=1 Tax=Fundicoccus sp. Sow4_H7 TaxID=3438784 RepID=UPI003F8F3293
MIDTEKEYIFNGPFARYCSMYVDHKKSLGYKFQVSSYYRLRQIDNFFKTYELKNPILTKKMVNDYVSKRGNESTKTQHQRMSTIRQFALFMNTLEFNFYVFPKNEFVKIRDNFTPYIFTHKEISNIWSIIDTLSLAENSEYDSLIYPMLLRMLYGCGLRINEALTLHKTDINLKNGVITINKAKNNITRLVPMSETLTDYCCNYVKKMAFDMKTKDYFYPAPDAQKYKSVSILNDFRRILLKAGIISSGSVNPRIHDLRHTFAVHSLEKMVSQGQDAYSALPILQTYMGHSDIISTEQYLRLTSDAYGIIINLTAGMYQDVFPEVKENE